MSHGKREMNSLDRARLWWDRHHRRILTTTSIVAIIMVTIAVVLSLWVRLPEVPVSTRPSLSGTTSNTGDGAEDLADVDIVSSDRQPGVYTFLVVGRDTAAGLTDTMILVTYDTVNKTIDAMSLPRDTMVNVSTSYKKLNGVYNLNKGYDSATQLENGMNALKSAVEGLTGIYPDFYVMVDWDAVGELVDAIDGVWFDVPYDMDYDDPEQDLYIHQEKGYRLLTGDDAMQVIRHRKNNDGSYSVGDVGRMSVQQDFLMAIAQQCLTPAMILNAPELANIFMEQVTTDLTVGNLLAFAQNALGINVAEDVNIVTMPYTDYYRYTSYVLPVQDKLLEIINNGLNPYVEDITAEDLQLLYVTGSAGQLSITGGQLADASLVDPVIYPTVEKDDETLDEAPEMEDPILPDDAVELDPETGEPIPPEEDTETQPDGGTPPTDEFTDTTEDIFTQPEPNLPDVTEPQEETDTSEEDVGEDPAVLEPIPSIESTQNNEETI